MKIIGTKFVLRAKYKKELKSGILRGEFPAWVKPHRIWQNTYYDSWGSNGSSPIARHTLKKYYRKA